MTIFSRKAIAVGATAVSLAAFAIVGATPASAAWHGGWGWGAPVAAGIIGGAVVGAAVAGAYAPYYYGPPVAYAAPACWFQSQPVYDPYGRFMGYRRVRVCN
jgi:hypothetical protein